MKNKSMGEFYLRLFQVGVLPTITLGVIKVELY